MRWAVSLLLIAGMAVLPAARAATPSAWAIERGGGDLVVLSYHEVRDDVRDYPDPYAVDSGALVQQFAWLKGNGYTPVRLQDVIAARKGGKALPPKAVLLTFDDAYLSFYTRVYPLLIEFGFPAMVGVVGSWIDGTEGEGTQYGEKSSVPDASFATWGQLREMVLSGLVEVASHSYDLHRGVRANPQGNVQPAATARTYDAASGRYEDDATWRERIRRDLAYNSARIERELGRRPRAIVWPYGAYNAEASRIAAALGMEVGLTLDPGINTREVPLTELRRVLMVHNPPLGDFVDEVLGDRYPPIIRVMQVNLDAIYSPDPAQQEANLSALLDRIYALKPSHVYLQAYAADPDGVASAAYFPNRQLPMRADLFNRVAWQIRTRTGAAVFAALPVSAFRLPAGGDPRARVAEIYEDLARHADFAGVLFQDENEAAAPIEVTRELVARMRAFRAPIRTARSLTVGPVPDAAPDNRFAQTLAAYVAAYDQVWVKATPPADESTEAWLTTLVARVDTQPGALRKTVFQLNSAAPASGSGAPASGAAPDAEAPGRVLAQQFEVLKRNGALNFGYTSDDYAQPPLAQIAPAMSLNVYPQ